MVNLEKTNHASCSVLAFLTDCLLCFMDGLGYTCCLMHTGTLPVFSGFLGA